jgi:hypothetical protein
LRCAGLVFGGRVRTDRARVCVGTGVGSCFAFVFAAQLSRAMNVPGTSRPAASNTCRSCGEQLVQAKSTPASTPLLGIDSL